MMRLFVAIVLALLTADAEAIDDETRRLFQEMSRQISELKIKAEQSDARIRELEINLQQEKAVNRQLLSAVKPVPEPKPEIAQTVERPVVTAGDIKGTFKIPGTDTSIGLGGYVKLDVAANSISAGNRQYGDQFLLASQIPVGDNRHGEHSQINFNPRETRMWLKSFTPSQRLGDINTYIELDLYGDPSGISPRLRHAYGSIDNLTIGQTWTTFLNVFSIPDTLDAGLTVGSVLIRQPLIRWSKAFTLGHLPLEWHAALEMPRGNFLASGAAATSNFDDNRYPDLLVRLNYKPAWGDLSFAALGRDFRYADNASRKRDQAWGGAFSLAGKVNVFALDNVRFAFNYGNAIGHYYFDPLEDAVLDSVGAIHLVTSYSAWFAYQHWWSSAWRSTLAYGFQHADQPAFLASTASAAAFTQQAQSLNANLLWSPLQQVTMGLEYSYAMRTVIDGRDGDRHRIMMSAKYNF